MDRLQRLIGQRALGLNSIALKELEQLLHCNRASRPGGSPEPQRKSSVWTVTLPGMWASQGGIVAGCEQGCKDLCAAALQIHV